MDGETISVQAPLWSVDESDDPALDTVADEVRRADPDGSRFAGAIRRTLEGTFGRVRVRGEITEMKRYPSGHIYLSLKDAEAKIEAVIWKSAIRNLGTLLISAAHADAVINADAGAVTATTVAHETNLCCPVIADQSNIW